MKVEDVGQAKKIALDFLVDKGIPVFVSEIQRIKKSDNVWMVEIKSKNTRIGEIILEIDAENGYVRFCKDCV